MELTNLMTHATLQQNLQPVTIGSIVRTIWGYRGVVRNIKKTENGRIGYSVATFYTMPKGTKILTRHSVWAWDSEVEVLR